jgi:hypothetical protein
MFLNRVGKVPTLICIPEDLNLPVWHLLLIGGRQAIQIPTHGENVQASARSAQAISTLAGITHTRQASFGMVGGNQKIAT